MKKPCHRGNVQAKYNKALANYCAVLASYARTMNDHDAATLPKRINGAWAKCAKAWTAYIKACA